MTTTSWLVPIRHAAPADLELWLERQAAAGRVVTEFDRLAPLRLTLEEREPATLRYALEYRAHPAPMDYYRSREEIGWQHAGRSGDLHLWYREYQGARPGGFIGGDELTHRSNRLSLGLAVFGIAAIVVALILGFTGPAGAAITLGVVGAVAVLAAASRELSQLTAQARTRAIDPAAHEPHALV